MKILHINTTDVMGGAGRAAYRLHTGLRDRSIDSRMLVRRKASEDEAVDQHGSRIRSKGRVLLDGLSLARYRERADGVFSTNWVPGTLASHVNEIDPDVVHLHWVGKGFLRIEDLPKIDAPIVWTLHDMWAFTGGCHYSGDCQRYTDACGTCPHLRSDSEEDLSRRVWSRKAEAWADVGLSLVTPSTWLAECVRESSLMDGQRVEVIPNGIDVDAFQPTNTKHAREQFGLPTDRPIVLFGAMNATSDSRKGFDVLLDGLDVLEKRGTAERFHVAVFGADDPSAELPTGERTSFLGYVDDSELPTLYGAADLTVVPSRQDNLPNTVLESLTCGTAVVAFDVGGIGDMVTHRHNGYLANPGDAADLASGIQWLVSDGDRAAELGATGRRIVEREFSLSGIVSDYVSKYERVQEASEKA